MPAIKSDVHVHTTFCDGCDSMQNMAEYAASIGLKTLGFAFHSYTNFDKSYCIRDYFGYMKELHRLKELYSGRLDILNGVELDIYGERPSICDYVIGSVHYLKHEGRYFAVDCSEDLFCDILKRVYRGDVMAMTKRYYEEVAELAQTVKPDIYGHFDLITRYNHGNKYFDANSGEYLRYARFAIDALPAGAVVEINHGRLFRGGGDIYPSEELIKIMNEKGVKFMLSSDAHCKQALAYQFDNTLPRLKALGVKSVAAYSDTNLTEIEI